MTLRSWYTCSPSRCWKVQVVAQRTAGRFGAHFVQVGAAGRAGAGAHQAFDLQRLERFAAVPLEH
jgi:hypothetical protein